MNAAETTLTGFGKYLKQAQREAGLSDDDMGRALGFEHPALYGHVLHGRAKLPMSRVPRVAQVLHVSEADFLREYFRAHFAGDVLDMLDRVLGNPRTAGERRVLAAYRAMMKGNEDGEVQVVDGRDVVMVLSA